MSINTSSTFKCPLCEWTIQSPFGEEDLSEHIRLHNAKHHEKTTKARISKSNLIRLQ